MPRYTDNDIKSATGVNLQEFLQAQGYELKKADGKSKKLEGYGGLYIFEKGFHHFSEDAKGNAIHFCRQYMDMGFQDAVQALLDFQGIRREEELNPPTYQKKTSYQKPTYKAKPKTPFQPKEFQAPQETKWENPPQFENQQKEEFRPPPVAEAYGMPPDDYDLPPEAFGMPPNDYDLPPEAFGMPPDDYGLPPEAYDMPPDDYGFPPEAHLNQQGGNSFSPQSQEEVVFQVPSMAEHDSFQRQETRPPPLEYGRTAPIKPKEESIEPMVLPPKSDDKSGYKSFCYLTQERALDKDIVNNLMKQGQIFEATTQFKD